MTDPSQPATPEAEERRTTLDAALTAWEKKGNTSLTTALVVDALYGVRDVLDMVEANPAGWGGAEVVSLARTLHNAPRSAPKADSDHDAKVRAEGARAERERVQAVLADDSLWTPLKKALEKPEYEGATLNSIYAPGVILDALARLLPKALARATEDES